MKSILVLILLVVACCNCSLTIYNSALISTNNFGILLSTGVSVSATATSGVSGDAYVLGKTSGIIVGITAVVVTGTTTVTSTTYSYPIPENGLEYVTLNGLVNIDVSMGTGNTMYISYFDTESLSVNALVLAHL